MELLRYWFANTLSENCVPFPIMVVVVMGSDYMIKGNAPIFIHCL